MKTAVDYQRPNKPLNEGQTICTGVVVLRLHLNEQTWWNLNCLTYFNMSLTFYVYFLFDTKEDIMICISLYYFLTLKICLHISMSCQRTVSFKFWILWRIVYIHLSVYKNWIHVYMYIYSLNKYIKTNYNRVILNLF